MVKTIPTAAVMEGVRILCGITSARANSHIAKEVCPEMKEFRRTEGFYKSIGKGAVTGENIRLIRPCPPEKYFETVG